MSLLPIIYTSVLIFCGVVTTVLIVSYTIYKLKGGGPKPVLVEIKKPVSYQNQRQVVSKRNNSYAVPHHHRNIRPVRSQEELMFYKKPITAQVNNVTRKTSVPRVQVLNKPAEKKIVVVRKSANYNSYDADNFLGYYNENERGVLIQA